LAEREGKEKVTLKHVDVANDKMDRDKLLDSIQCAPKQLQLVLYSIINLSENKNSEKIFTGDIYNLYQQFCQKTRTEILTQRRVSDLIAEADMMGIINASVISKGRHGRTREITPLIPPQIMQKAKQILLDALGL